MSNQNIGAGLLAGSLVIFWWILSTIIPILLLVFFIKYWHIFLLLAFIMAMIGGIIFVLGKDKNN